LRTIELDVGDAAFDGDDQAFGAFVCRHRDLRFSLRFPWAIGWPTRVFQNLTLVLRNSFVQHWCL
jgi:hypothetical protein